MEEESQPKLHAAVVLGRRGGLVKSAAKTRAARLNGLKGGAPSWKTPRHLTKKTGPKPKGTPPPIKPIKRKRKVKITETLIREIAPQ